MRQLLLATDGPGQHALVYMLQLRLYPRVYTGLWSVYVWQVPEEGVVSFREEWYD
jgi:hypothetical protein